MKSTSRDRPKGLDVSSKSCSFDELCCNLMDETGAIVVFSPKRRYGSEGDCGICVKGGFERGADIVVIRGDSTGSYGYMIIVGKDKIQLAFMEIESVHPLK